MKAYWRFESMIAPGLTYSQTAYEKFLEEYVSEDSRWLDLGCGRQLLPSWRKESEIALLKRPQLIVGIDPDFPSVIKHETINLRVCGNSDGLPYADQSFSLVTANMVMEHVEDPERLLAELWRVVRPGGVFLFHTPNARSYQTFAARLLPERLKLFFIRLLEERTPHDVFPTWYRINSADEIGRHARKAGFQVETIEPIMTSAAFAKVLPVAILELFLIRGLMTSRMAKWRTNLIAVLRKPAREATSNAAAS